MSKQQSSDSKTFFSVDQRIVYPLQGVGHIKNILERPFKGVATQYYEIYFSVTDMTVMIPVDKAEEQGIRALVGAEKAREALEFISTKSEQVNTDWKLRYQMNMDLLKDGDLTKIAEVVKNLYHRSKVKELPIMERKLYESARKLLLDEIAFCLDIPSEEVEQMVFSRLETEKIPGLVDDFEDDLEEEVEEFEPEEEEDED